MARYNFSVPRRTQVNILSLSCFCFYVARALLLVVVSNLLLWQKASSIPACVQEKGGCWNPLEETFNSAIQKAETLRNLANKLNEELVSTSTSMQKPCMNCTRTWDTKYHDSNIRKYTFTGEWCPNCLNSDRAIWTMSWNFIESNDINIFSLLY